MPHRKRYLAGLLLTVGLLSARPGASRQPVLTPPASGTPVIAEARPIAQTASPAPAASTAAPLPTTTSSPLVADDGLVTLPPIGSEQRTSFSPRATPKPNENGAAVPPRASALSVEVLGPAESMAGTPLSYEIVVRNLGALPLAGVRIDEPLPAGTQLRAAEPTPERQGDRLIWNLGTLEGTGERHLRLEIQPGGQTELMLTPSATYTATSGLRTQLTQPPAPVKVPSAPTAVAPPTVPGSATFVVSQTGPDTVQRGAMVAMRIQAANRGTTPLMHVILRDLLPPGLQHPAGSKIEADIGNLAPGETKSLSLEVVAAQTGRLVNEINAVADGGRLAQSRTAIQVADAVLGVKIEMLERTTVAQDINVQLDASNPGSTPAVNVRLRQMVPDGFDILAASNGGVIDPQTRSVAWVFNSLPAGQKPASGGRTQSPVETCPATGSGKPGCPPMA